MNERQQNYGAGNRAILEALEKNGRSVVRALPAFMRKAAQDPLIIREALEYYYEDQAEHVREEMDEEYDAA